MTEQADRLMAITSPVKRLDRLAVAMATAEEELAALHTVHDQTLSELRAAGYG